MLKILFIYILSRVMMYINEISDFYDCLSPGTKKEISKLYRVKQLNLEQKKDFYRGFVSIQEYKRKTGKSIDEIINGIIDPAKNFIKDVLKDKHIIEKYKNFQNMKFDCRYKKGMLEKCLKKWERNIPTGF
uniref:ORF30 n=1 Tax=Borreliella burgdorferi TaxID=139 RepID=Q9L9M6_BORBG|nr:ORF30 [Borreliella burgdorferi]